MYPHSKLAPLTPPIKVNTRRETDAAAMGGSLVAPPGFRDVRLSEYRGIKVTGFEE